MKILLYNWMFYPYGGGRANSTRYLARFLAKKGHEVTVYTHKVSEELKEQADFEGYRIIRKGIPISIDDSKFIVYFKKLRQEIENYKWFKKNVGKFDVFHIQGPTYGFPIIPFPYNMRGLWIFKGWKFSNSIPRILTLRGLIDEKNNYEIRNYVDDFKHADKVFCVSRATKKQLESLGFNSGYIPNGVDIFMFKPKKKQNKIFTLGFNSGFTKGKGLVEVLTALKEIKKQDKEIKIKLLFAGGREDEEKDFENLVKTRGIDRLIEYAGRIDYKKMPEFYNRIDVFLFPSYTEGMPPAVIEAISCGIPVITTRVGAIPDIVTEKEALFVPVRDSKKLKEAILLLKENKKLREKMSKACVVRSKLFDVRKTVELYEQAYKDLNQKFNK